MLTKFKKLMEQNEFINKAHNLKMKEKQSRAKKQRRRMQNLLEHVKLLMLVYHLEISLQSKEI